MPRSRLGYSTGSSPNRSRIADSEGGLLRAASSDTPDQLAIHFAPEPHDNVDRCLHVHARRVEVDDTRPQHVPVTDDGVGEEDLAAGLYSIEKPAVECIETTLD